LVGGSNIIRSQHTPFRIKPRFGQVSEYLSETSTGSKEAWDILQEDEAGSYLTKDPSDVGPYPPFI